MCPLRLIKNITVLPNSEAEITSAGTDILDYLDYHPNSLLPSTVVPQMVNESGMTPISRIPYAVHLQVNNVQTSGPAHYSKDKRLCDIIAGMKVFRNFVRTS